MKKTKENSVFDKFGYRVLEEDFTEKGYTYNQIHRAHRFAIYTQSKDGRIISYEAVYITRQEETECYGRILPKREHYPSTGEFGKLGFSCKTKERAFEKLEELKKRRDELDLEAKERELSGDTKKIGRSGKKTVDFKGNP